MLGRLLWGTTKFAIKHVAVPIITTMIIAAVATELSRRMRGEEADGAETEAPAQWHAQP